MTVSCSKAWLSSSTNDATINGSSIDPRLVETFGLTSVFHRHAHQFDEQLARVFLPNDAAKNWIRDSNHHLTKTPKRTRYLPDPLKPSLVSAGQHWNVSLDSLSQTCLANCDLSFGKIVVHPDTLRRTKRRLTAQVNGRLAKLKTRLPITIELFQCNHGTIGQ